MFKTQSEASNNGVEVSVGEMVTWNVTVTVMLELGSQDDEDAEYIVLLELSCCSSSVWTKRKSLVHEYYHKVQFGKENKQKNISYCEESAH